MTDKLSSVSHRRGERRLVLSPFDRESRVALLTFGALAVIYLCSFGPFNSALVQYHIQWNVLILLLSGVGFLVIRYDAIPSAWSTQYAMAELVALGLIAVIVGSFAMHGMAMQAEPGHQWVNVSGVTISGWMYEHIKFTGFYLFFPILFVLQLLVLRTLSLNMVVRTISIIFVLSVAVQYYQGIVDDSFLNRWQIGTQRVGGLATDPNAYAMTALIVIPLMLAGAVNETGKWRVLLLVIGAFVLLSLPMTGNRTAAGGLVLLLSLSPVILMIANNNLSPRTRVVLLLTPIAIIGAMIGIVAYFPDALADSSVLGARIARSWEKIQHGGLMALAFEGEVRGEMLLIGWLLLWKAPFSGWGAGGFYREYPNAYLEATGEIRAAFDSVLNHYLMIPIDLGLPALGVYLILMLIPMVVGISTLRVLQDVRSRLIVTILLVSQVVFLLAVSTIPPAYFPDVVWLWTVALALLLVLGERAGVRSMVGRWVADHRFLSRSCVVVLVIVSVASAYPVTFGDRGYHSRLDVGASPLRFERNCYGVESDGETQWRWCGRNARMKIPLDDAEQDEITVRLIAGNPDIQRNPLSVRYGGYAGPMHEVVLSNPSSVEIRIPLDDNYVIDLSDTTGESNHRFVVLSLDMSRTWVPKQWGVNADMRELGVRIQLP